MKIVCNEIKSVSSKGSQLLGVDDTTFTVEVSDVENKADILDELLEDGLIDHCKKECCEIDELKKENHKLKESLKYLAVEMNEVLEYGEFEGQHVFNNASSAYIKAKKILKEISR